jgi:hypothetical protein
VVDCAQNHNSCVIPICKSCSSIVLIREMINSKEPPSSSYVCPSSVGNLMASTAIYSSVRPSTNSKKCEVVFLSSSTSLLPIIRLTICNFCCNSINSSCIFLFISSCHCDICCTNSSVTSFTWYPILSMSSFVKVYLVGSLCSFSFFRALPIGSFPLSFILSLTFGTIFCASFVDVRASYLFHVPFP